MTKEVKTIFLVALSLSVYATFTLIQQGGFVYPYPLNSFVFLAITLQFCFWHRRQVIIALLVSLVGILGVLNNQVFWEIVLSSGDLQNFMKNPMMYWINLAYGLSIISWAMVTFKQQKKVLPSVLTVIAALIFGYGFFFASEISILISFMILVISISLKPVYQPFHLLWILLLILEATKWISHVLA